MELTESDDVELAVEVDPATEAFARLEGEMALVRRAVEHLAAEKGDIRIPDYTATLGEMAQRLGAIAQGMNTIADKPAMQFTPDSLGARIEAAAASARRTDHDQLTDARKRFDQGAQDMQKLVAKVHSANDQRRRLWQGVAGGMLAGILLWSFLPGVVARTMPESWHMPERLARHIVGEPTLWEAGTRIMRADSPEAWDRLNSAGEMWRDNREAIDACEQAASKANQPVRCTIRVRNRQP